MVIKLQAASQLVILQCYSYMHLLTHQNAGETESQYSNVTSTNKIPTWPVDSPARWNVLLDSFIVGTETYSVSTGVQGAPSNKAVVLLDSGTSYTCVIIYVNGGHTLLIRSADTRLLTCVKPFMAAYLGLSITLALGNGPSLVTQK
jgi:hypothetical protein